MNEIFTVKKLKQYLDTLPENLEVYCVQDEVFSNMDKAPDYFPAIFDTCFIVQDDVLYIGNIEP